MRFTLDDIENLALVGGRNRLDKTGEYDISYYEKLIEEDIQTIEKLINYANEKVNCVQDEKTRNFLKCRIKKRIEKVYKAIREKNPKEEFEKKGERGGVEYYETHPYVHYIERDIPNYVTSNYTEIIGVMNELYQRIKYLEGKKMYSEYRILYEIFEKTKKTCKELGIHSLSAEQLCDIIAEKELGAMLVLDMDSEIISGEEPMENDIGIESLPYFITLQSFSYAGVGETYQMPVSRAVVWYNQSYIDKLDKKSEELTNMVEESTRRELPRERNLQESDEDYINYLKEFYGEGTQHK